MAERVGSTSTSNFGVSRRENHDSSNFYARFQLPRISLDDALGEPPGELGDGCFHGDSRLMKLPDGSRLADNTVALVVTSPPYFAGKQYEEALGDGNVPASYIDFLDMLHDVFKECARVLEPGGRIAVNVANLGRKPYRSLSADVIRIFEDLGLLLRGEVIWQKGQGSAGNCAWGSFRSAANPVLRDITERVVIASKGRFDRARSPQQRHAEGRPHENTLTSDEFMSATLDLWQMEPESARRVNHPAPFPVELPERLIHLYTYKDDLVLDPFMGSGTTLVAARRTARRGIGFDLDPDYVEIARSRVAQESKPHQQPDAPRRSPQRRPVRLDIAPDEGDGDANFQARATREGKAAQAIAEQRLVDAGFVVVGKNSKLRGTGVLMNVIAHDNEGRPWYFDVTGAFTTTRGGLRRTDTVWKCLGRAHVIQNRVNTGVDITPLVFLTSHLPRPGSEGDIAMRAAGPLAFFDAIEMLSEADFARLSRYANGDSYDRPLPGFWSESEIDRLARRYG